MKERKTTKCKKHGHSEFKLSFDDYVIDPWIDWLVDYLEKSVKSENYEDGETMQIGWMVNLIKKENGDLTLCEPDFKKMPVHWVASVSATLSHLFLQKYVAESLGLEKKLDIPTLTNTAIRCNKFGKQGAKFFASRTEPSENNPDDSGWFLGCVDEKHDHNNPKTLSLISLYEAATINPSIVPYLSLPENVSVMETGDPREFEIGIDDELLSVKEGSYLDKWLDNRIERDPKFEANQWHRI